MMRCKCGHPIIKHPMSFTGYRHIDSKPNPSGFGYHPVLTRRCQGFLCKCETPIEVRKMSKKFWEGNPEGKKGYTKVIRESSPGIHEGVRVKVIAVDEKDKEVVAIGLNSEIWGRICLCRQTDPTKWMKIINDDFGPVPHTDNWRILY